MHNGLPGGEFLRAIGRKGDAPGGDWVAVLDGSEGGDAGLEHPTEVTVRGETFYVVDQGNSQIDVWRRQ